jgi:hypothetical protein
MNIPPSSIIFIEFLEIFFAFVTISLYLFFGKQPAEGNIFCHHFNKFKISKNMQVSKRGLKKIFSH